MEVKNSVRGWWWEVGGVTLQEECVMQGRICDCGVRGVVI